MKIKAVNHIFARSHLLLTFEIFQYSITAFDSAPDYARISHSALFKAILAFQAN